MVKRLVIMLCVIFCFSIVLAACSSKPNDVTSTGQDSKKTTNDAEPVAEQPAKKMEIGFFSLAPDRIEDMATNTFSRFIEDKFNLDIKWELAEDTNIAKTLLFASGEYPEVFLHVPLSKTELLQNGTQDIFVPLNDLIEQHAPNITKALDSVPNLRNDLTAPDGNIYGLPQISECLFCYYSQKYWINTVWLEELGLDMPTTTEEFHNVLKAFKEKDPNGNGKPDEIPLTGSPNMWNGRLHGFLMNAFIYTNDQFLYVEDGKLDTSANKQEFKQGLEYIHRLYTEGLIDPEAFTQDSGALNAKVNQDVALVGVVSEGAYNDFTISKEGETRYKEYDAVPPLTGPNGVKLATYYGGVDGVVFAITSKASEEQQIAAIKMADYLYSEEGTLYSQNGANQEFWKPAETGEKDFNGQQAKYKFDTASLISAETLQNDCWSNIGPLFASSAFRESDVAPQDIYAPDASQIRLTTETKNKYVGFEPKELPPLSIFVSSENSDEFNQLYVQVINYIRASVVQFIVGQLDINKDWDAYVKGLDNLDIEKYVNYYRESSSYN